MEEPERLPCPTCRQPVELEAELCLQCGASLLVDVVLPSPVTDGRVRYRLSRTLSGLPGSPPIAAIQGALVGSPPAAARGVRRAYAHAVLPVLAENHLRGSIEKHVKPGREAASRSGRPPLAWPGSGSSPSPTWAGSRSSTGWRRPSSA